MKPHKHAALIKAWADGAEIEFQLPDGTWFNATPDWSEFITYRIKPKPDVISYVYVDEGKWMTFSEEHHEDHNLKLTFDGDTLALKTAEVIK